MSEATLAFDNPDQIRTLLGTRDQYLRQVRDSLGVDVVLKGDELRLMGDDEQIRRGLEVLEELKQIVITKGRLHDEDVRNALSGQPPVTVIAEPAASGNGNGNGSGNGHRPIDLFEKAKKVHPRTAGQAEYTQAIADNDLIFCAGPAGCGKTYLAVAMAINALRTERVRKIVLTRPAVEAGERLGFLPGDMLAKVNPYLRPLLDALHDLLDYEQVKRYMEKDVIEIAPLAFMRGRTLNSTFIILDEAQNTTVTQMKMFLTRMGYESKIVVTGDTTQIDLPPHVPCGLVDAMDRLESIDGVATVRMSGRDIVRHRLVREVVKAYDDNGSTPPRKPKAR